MPTCPARHESETPDYCSVCGLAMAAAVAEFCPRCDEPRIGLFCEQCGHSYSYFTGRSPPWSAVVAPDRDYFDAGGAAARKFTFPASSAGRRVELTGHVVRIGRRSVSRGITPEIDLSTPPADPCVSREHARLLARPDGSWAVVDDSSENGTYLNGGSQPIPNDQAIPLTDGDRIHLGVWTTITLRREPGRSGEQ
ncbi:MAG: FHA domain-containing protein [Pseudonocardiaceae bacterium]